LFADETREALEKARLLERAKIAKAKNKRQSTKFVLFSSANSAVLGDLAGFVNETSEPS
jgi:hypothetical protein